MSLMDNLYLHRVAEFISTHKDYDVEGFTTGLVRIEDMELISHMIGLGLMSMGLIDKAIGDYKRANNI